MHPSIELARSTPSYFEIEFSDGHSHDGSVWGVYAAGTTEDIRRRFLAGEFEDEGDTPRPHYRSVDIHNIRRNKVLIYVLGWTTNREPQLVAYCLPLQDNGDFPYDEADRRATADGLLETERLTIEEDEILAFQALINEAFPPLRKRC